MRIYTDISCFCRTNYRAGIQRVLRELLGRLLRQDGLPIAPLRYDESSRTFLGLDSASVLGWLEADEGPLGETALRGKVTIDDFAPGDLFFDLDAAWVTTWRRSDLYPRLKDRGVKIVSYIYDIIPYLVTAVVLVFVSLKHNRANQPPASLGLSYFREER